MEKQFEAKLTIPEWIVERWCVACYLVINWKIADLIRQIEFKPDKNFYQLTAKYLYDYAHKDKMPPEDIAPTILNLAEDYISGNPVKFRTGDYIAMQNHVRNLK